MSVVAKAMETLEEEFAVKSTQESVENASAAELHQFVIFHVEGERFAVSLSEVQEIIRVPDVVHMPLSPASLEGLANLRGSVLPVLNLRQVFRFPQALHDDSTRVVVLDHGRPIGLIVDRMANVVTVGSEQIEPASTISSSINVDFVTGIIKEKDGHSMVVILDARLIVEREFQDLLNADTLKVVRATEATVSEALKAESAVVEEDQLVSFEVAGQEYAFPIEKVKEIVQLPEHVSDVPNTASHVLGVITLRNRLLPLVSLRELFGLPRMQMTDANKVAVISPDGNSETSVGVVMDSVREVLRVRRDEMEEVPDLLRGIGPGNNIASICRLQGGRRLVSVLAAENMFDQAELDHLHNSGEDEMARSQADSVATSSSEAVDDEQFVLFILKGEEYGVHIDCVQEIVRVPSELTRIPKCPDFIEGVINLRGVVLPVVDQRRRFQLESIDRNDRQRIMVFIIGGVRTGFIVDLVTEVRRIPLNTIAAAPELSVEQKRIIRRVANLEGEKRIIMLLDVLQLLNSDEMSTISNKF
ncbi:chemotaxis protein CheW [Asticcacaulis benevestitus]|uniref:Chemotaxis protein CheW n=1 Tax=Asticcacaulis benevestitus DSM 16100 = ATCC BAA-896 TaxID=1121022 RepID=V4RN04_9CAUL|nr:chemotaxis protein CheW [Asticcacaulis benevestitus]ESQ92623.1 hypothetical protein ABENE_07335 [Asticcacaulis benevestitus DSM 16100 = ATCC BAA-896]